MPWFPGPARMAVRCLASGGTNGIWCWDATAGTEIGKPLCRHAGIQALVAWTGPDGHMLLASAGSDGTIRRWDATAHRDRKAALPPCRYSGTRCLDRPGRPHAASLRRQRRDDPAVERRHQCSGWRPHDWSHRGYLGTGRLDYPRRLPPAGIDQQRRGDPALARVDADSVGRGADLWSPR